MERRLVNNEKAVGDSIKPSPFFFFFYIWPIASVGLYRTPNAVPIGDRQTSFTSQFIP